MSPRVSEGRERRYGAIKEASMVRMVRKGGVFAPVWHGMKRLNPPGHAEYGHV
jgi:hypothetical protein